MGASAAWERGVRSVRRALGAFATLVCAVLLSGCARPAPLHSDPSLAAMPPVQCQVVGRGSDPTGELDRLRQSCERALPVVAGVWPGWTGSALVLLSSTPLEPGTAARVEGQARPGEPAQEDHVLVAPGLADRLSPEGLDIVLRHELTHLAMRSTGTAPLPRWLSEGMAAHVGYSAVPDLRRERRSDLARLRGLVETGGWTGTVPDAHAFEDPATRTEADTAAWLGVEVLLDRLGQEHLVEVVQRPPGGAGQDAQLTDEERTRAVLGSLGLDRMSFDERWRAELENRSS